MTLTRTSGAFWRINFADIKRTHVWKIFIPNDSPSRDDDNKLVWKSSGQFIYAATIIRFISSSESDSPVDRSLG